MKKRDKTCFISQFEDSLDGDIFIIEYYDQVYENRIIDGVLYDESGYCSKQYIITENYIWYEEAGYSNYPIEIEDYEVEVDWSFFNECVAIVEKAKLEMVRISEKYLVGTTTNNPSVGDLISFTNSVVQVNKIGNNRYYTTQIIFGEYGIDWSESEEGEFDADLEKMIKHNMDFRLLYPSALDLLIEIAVAARDEIESKIKEIVNSEQIRKIEEID